MAMSNQERVGKAMDRLRMGLAPFVEREAQSAIEAGTVRMDAVRRFAQDPMPGNKPIVQWDVGSLLKLMWETWNDVLKRTRGFAERSLVLVSELAGRSLKGTVVLRALSEQPSSSLRRSRALRSPADLQSSKKASASYQKGDERPG